MDCWDLQAIVRGHNFNSEASTSTSIMNNPSSSSSSSYFTTSSHQQQDSVLSFPDICETTTILDELEQLYKPFYPQTILTTNTTSLSVPIEIKKPKKQYQHQQPQTFSAHDTDHDHHHQAAKLLKRGKRNQQKRVMQQVTADGLFSDKWAWRKYGQKPIKGSPYPRSYYRCSSSKGCLARKQVERSNSDPGMYTITYSAEHNHSYPTRRSSLAGSTRSGSKHSVNKPAEQTLLISSMEDHEILQEQENVKEHVFVKEEEENGIVTSDLTSSDGMFHSLEDLEDFLLDHFSEDVDDSFVDKLPNWFISEPAAVQPQGLGLL